jgi:cysteine desulfurase
LAFPTAHLLVLVEGSVDRPFVKIAVVEFMPLFLDFNATTPVDKRVLSIMQPFFCEKFGSAESRDHAYGWNAAEAVEEARLHAADLIHAKPTEIIFTEGATESINLGLKGIACLGRPPRATIASAVVEHEAVIETCRQLQRLTRTQVHLLPVDRFGNIDLVEWEDQIASLRPTLVSLMFANNEIGNINPVGEVARMAHDVGALFFTDATQALGKIPVDVPAEGIDLAAFSAHKVYGPKGVGALFIRSGSPKIELEPLLAGGGQERGLRSGTLNVPGIVGFGEACRIAQLEMQADAERMRRLRDKLEQSLLRELPDVFINGNPHNRLPNTTNLAFAGVDARTLIRDMHIVAVSTRSACSSGAPGPSHVLKALGLSDDLAYSSIRFSLGRFTMEEEIDRAIELVTSSVRKLRSRRPGRN